MLQEIVRAEHQRRGAGQLVGLDPVREVPGDERRTGQGAIAHRPQQYAAGPGHRPLTGAHARGHFSGTHAFEADRLILHHQVEQQMLLGAKFPHGLSPPGGQAVGVEGDAQTLGQAFFVKRRHQALQIALQQAHLLHMVEQAPADLRGCRWRGPYQYRLADASFKQFDALGYRRLGQPQHLCRAFEPGLLDHSSKGGQQFIVEHQFS
ncbi:hypothetical protein D3C78_909290 [compost metagenome]